MFLGVFLSGGIDSSLVTALMQAQSTRAVRSFSIGFREGEYNEAAEAKRVAQWLGTDHTELYVTPAKALDVLPLLPVIYDEPFADSSQLPTYLLSMLTRQHVTVALSGDGGDELFGGYNRYVWVNKIWKAAGWLPLTARRAVARTLTALEPRRWDSILGSSLTLPNALRHREPGEKVRKLAAAIAEPDRAAMYRQLASHWTEKDALVLGAKEPATLLRTPDTWAKVSDFAEQMMYLDAVSYLPDDILVKVDRASMAVGLETRIPYLDHRVIEFVWRLPLSLKFRNGTTKWLLRQMLTRYVPRTLTERPKCGFTMPIDSWLRGPLREWADTLLDERRLLQDGILNVFPIRQKWAEHLTGRQNWQYHLWDVLVFQAWLEGQAHFEPASLVTALAPQFPDSQARPRSY